MIRFTLCLKFTILIFGFLFRSDTYNNEESIAVDRWMILLQVAKELSDQWNLTRIGEDPAVDVWMADVSHLFLKFSVKVNVMNNVNFPERDLLFYIYASLVAFLELITFYRNFLFKLLQFNLKFYLNFPIVVTIIYHHFNYSIRIWNWSQILLYTCTI